VLPANIGRILREDLLNAYVKRREFRMLDESKAEGGGEESAPAGRESPLSRSVRASAHRDHEDRRIVITRIGRS